MATMHRVHWRPVLVRTASACRRKAERFLFYPPGLDGAVISKAGRRIDIPHFILVIGLCVFLLYTWHYLVPWTPRLSVFPGHHTLSSATFPTTAAVQVTAFDIERGLLMTSPDPGAAVFNASHVLFQLTMAAAFNRAACVGAAHFGIPIPVIALGFSTPADPFKPEVAFQPPAFPGQPSIADWTYAQSDITSLSTELVSNGDGANQQGAPRNRRFLFIVNPECTPDDSNRFETIERTYPCLNSGLSTQLGVTRLRAQSVLCTGRFLHPAFPGTSSPTFSVKLFKSHAICVANHFDLASRDVRVCVNQTM